MQGSLGEKIGGGVFSDVYAWAPGQVVKLFKAGVSQRLARHEARMIRAVYTAGAPSPDVLDEVTLEGRFGVVLSRLDGPTLMQLSRNGAVTPAQTGAILASLYKVVHGTPSPHQVLSLRAWLEAWRLFSGGVPQPIAAGILALMERLPSGGVLCHADLHPGNVIMTADGPRLVDWTGAVRAPAEFDLACGHILLHELSPEFTPNPERLRAYNAAAQSEYARLVGMSEAALTAAIELYLPIACVIQLLWGARGAVAERMMQRIEAAFIVNGFPRTSQS